MILMRYALLTCLAWVVFFVPALADTPYADPAEQRYSAYSGSLEACDDWHVVQRIQSSFAWNQGSFYQPKLWLKDLKDIQEISQRGNGLEYIPRRYCTARGIMGDGAEHVVYYDIVEDQGIIGFGSGVEYCVDGLEPTAACSHLRPYVERFLGRKVVVDKTSKRPDVLTNGGGRSHGGKY